MTTMIIALALLLPATAALAQVRYQDGEGVMNWVDSIDQVPPEYRSGAVGTPTSPPIPDTRPPGIAEEQTARDTERQQKDAQSDVERLAEQELAARRARNEEQQRRNDQELAATEGARALQRAADERQAAWMQAVGTCRDAVRRSDWRFDAFASTPGRAQTVGTVWAKLAFADCMAQAGHSLE